MENLGHIFGYLSLLLGWYSLTLKNDRKLTFYQIIVNALLIPHFFLLGSASSAVAVAFITLRVLTAYLYKNNITYSIFMLLGIAQLFYAGYQSLPWYEYLPILAGILVTHTYFKLEKIPMRILFIIGGVLWIIASMAMESYSVAILNFTGIIIHLITMARIYKDDKLITI